ncbi:hypothetical protein Mgra_00009346 [Meloidogyne graminicola]|uniref:SFR19-like C-terminal domain-containing protein n=1 Tax=Meloidogyne graminicola TaxID=189291 RepID=A0A8S9ZC84_9BILA|nr:hypothetical protein Mgra_00009346 [Meloidogyne graminicola]
MLYCKAKQFYLTIKNQETLNRDNNDNNNNAKLNDSNILSNNFLPWQQPSTENLTKTFLNLPPPVPILTFDKRHLGTFSLSQNGSSSSLINNRPQINSGERQGFIPPFLPLIPPPRFIPTLNKSTTSSTLFHPQNLPQYPPPILPNRSLNLPTSFPLPNTLEQQNILLFNNFLGGGGNVTTNLQQNLTKDQNLHQNQNILQNQNFITSQHFSEILQQNVLFPSQQNIQPKEILIDDSDNSTEHSPLPVPLPQQLPPPPITSIIPPPPPPPPPPPLPNNSIEIEQHLNIINDLMIPLPPPINNSHFGADSPMDIENELTERPSSDLLDKQNISSPNKNSSSPTKKRSKSVQLADKLMKQYLKPYYVKRKITKDEYKDIMKRGVTKLSKRNSLKSEKVEKFVQKYVRTTRRQRRKNNIFAAF